LRRRWRHDGNARVQGRFQRMVNKSCPGVFQNVLDVLKQNFLKALSMKKILPLISFTVGFTALALTEALAQSPEIPEAPIIQLLGTFDYPGTGNQTRPQKINDVGDVVGIFVD